MTQQILSSELFDEELGDDDVFVLESIAEATQRKDDKLRVTLVFTLKDTMTSLAKIIKIIEVSIFGGALNRGQPFQFIDIESRFNWNLYTFKV